MDYNVDTFVMLELRAIGMLNDQTGGEKCVFKSGSGNTQARAPLKSWSYRGRIGCKYQIPTYVISWQKLSV
jgi:hypothetical protein